MTNREEREQELQAWREKHELDDHQLTCLAFIAGWNASIRFKDCFIKPTSELIKDSGCVVRLMEHELEKQAKISNALQ